MILMGKRNNTKRVKIICHLTEMRCDRNERQFRFLDWMSIKRAGMLKKKRGQGCQEAHWCCVGTREQSEMGMIEKGCLVQRFFYLSVFKILFI